MALHVVYITERDPESGEVVNRHQFLLDFTELLKPERVARLYAKATGVSVDDLRVNVIRE